MADILKYRLPDGTQTQVIENTKTVNLPFTTASLDFSVILDDLAVEPDEVRGWFAEQPVLTSAQRSEEYGLTVSLNQGETKTVVIKTVDAKSVSDLVSGRFNNFRDTFTITVIRATAPTVEDSDSSSPTFLTYPDSSATLTIINSSFTIQDSSVVFGVVDSDYIAARQRRDFSYLINTPTTLDSYGITQFDSDFDSALATKTTDNLTEGNNQYFTQSRARQSISATDAGGAGSLSYNNSNGVITYTGPSDSEIRSKLSASNDLTYNPNTGVFSIDVEVKYTKTNFDSDLGDANTGQLPEGSNLYFTNARARASVSADKGLVYSDGTGVFNIDSSHIINKVIYPNTIDSTRTIALIDSAYIQARDRFRDSAFVLSTADSAHVQSKIPHAYVQALQIQYNTNDFTDSAFVNSRPISTFTNDAKYLDSTTGQNLINTAYIQSKQIQYNTSDFLDSTTVELVVDSAYVQSRQYNLTSTDSLSEGSSNLYFTNERVDDRVGALITGGVNVTATYDDAAGTLEIKVPFENIDDRVGNILTAGSGININYDDPNATITITNTLNTSDFPDSAFVTSRPVSTFTNDALYLDSTTAQNLINASYIQSNQIQYNTSDFTDSAFVTGLPVSTFTNDKNYLDSTYAAALIDSAHIKAIVDSDYVQLIQADLQRDSGFISSVITGGTLDMGANNIITTGKVLFANVYSQLSDLPSATTYHGMFAHVHGTGKAYYAHAGAWIELANNSQLSNSGNWNTAYSWGDHSAAGYLTSSLDSAMIYRFTIDSARTLQLVDSDVVLSKLYPNSFGRDSAVKLYYNDVKKFETTDSGAKISGDLTLETTNATIRLGSLILQDSGGQLRIADSAGVTTTVIRNVLDSALITQLIDAPYIQARQNLLDSDLTKQLIDSAYITIRDRFSLIESDLTKQLIDSAYINARVSTVDSAAVQAIIDSSYLEVIIDSDYVTARAGVILDSASIASGVIATTVDAAYVQARQQKYNTSDFTDSAFVTGLPVSTFTNDVQYLDSTTVQGVISASYIQSNQNDYLDSTLTSQLIDSAYIALRTTTGTDSSTVINLIDSDYVSSRVVAFANPIFTEFKYIAESAGQVVFEGNDANGNALSIETGNHAVFVNGIRLLPSDFTADVTSNRITLDSTGSALDEIVISTIKGKNALAGIAIIDSDYIASRTIAVAQPQFVNYKYNADGNQTEFGGGVADINGQTVALSPGNFTVFLNGIKLLDSDFTANTSTNVITLSSGATLNDELVIQTIIGQNAVAGVSAVDSSYVQLRVPASYIQANQTKFLDSSLTSQLIDSAYIALRTTAGTDSATVIGLIDSDYVAARVTGVVTPQFTDFRYKADSGQTLFSGADLGGTSLNLRTDNFNVFLNGIKLIDSDFTANISNNTITLTEGADSGDDLVITTVEGDVIPNDATVIDSAYVQARQEGVNATFKDYKFVATANQTVFSGTDANGTALSFEANKFHVLLNGIRLDASDFTESAANNKITLATGAAVSDELIVSTIGTEKTTTLASITSTVDSAYVQARQADLQRDSAFITDIIDSAYIEPLLTPIHIDGNSNVGVGTTSVENTYSQSHTVEIAGRATDNNWGGSLILSSNNQTNVFTRLVSSTDGLDLINTKNTNIRFFTNNTHRMTIAGNGQVVLNPVSAIDPTLRINQSNNTRALQFNTAGVERGTIRVFDTGVQYNTTSDYRLKENVVTDWDATTRLKQLKPSRFNFIADSSKTLDGFLAHEVSSVVPEAISGEKDAVDSDKNPYYQGIDQSKLVPLLTKALQEAVTKIETLEAKVAALEGGG